jgi:peroxin-5
MAKWESGFNQLMSSQREELEHDYSGAMQDAWEGGLGDFHDSGIDRKIEKLGYPILTEYAFGERLSSSLMHAIVNAASEQNNKYMDPSTTTQSPLSEAKAMLERDCPLAEAALLLEAAIQKGELGEGGYEAWILLGETRSMDEREELGMRALMEGVRRAEEAGATGMGMLVRIYHLHHRCRGSSTVSSPLRYHSPMNHMTGHHTTCSGGGYVHGSLRSR